MMNRRAIAHTLTAAAGGLFTVALGVGAVAATPLQVRPDGDIAAYPVTLLSVSGQTVNGLAAFTDDPLLAALGAVPPMPVTPVDVDISVFGIDLFNGGGTAHATSGAWDIAIAIGPNATAEADGGVGDFASAISTGSLGATARAGNDALGATGNDFNYASAYGNDSIAEAGYAGAPNATGNSFNIATAVGGNDPAETLAEAGFNSSADYASATGENVNALAGFSAAPTAVPGFDVASALGNFTTPTTNSVLALAGNNGFGDLAFVADPFGTLGSTAEAGMAHSFDLAGVFGDNLNALSTTADFLVHILPFF